METTKSVANGILHAICTNGMENAQIQTCILKGPFLKKKKLWSMQNDWKKKS